MPNTMAIPVPLKLIAVAGALMACIYQLADGEQEWKTNPSTSTDKSTNTAIPGEDSSFAMIDGDSYQTIHYLGGDVKTMLTGRLFLPFGHQTAAKSPMIVLATGLGLVQDYSLDPYVTAFQKAGFAAFTFDYRTFGLSDGYPRHQVKPQRHVEDLKATLKMIHARSKTSLSMIDVNRIGLWGTSLRGGHVLMTATAAANDLSGILAPRAVVAQVPHVRSATESVIGTVLRDPVNGTIGLLKFLGAVVKAGVSAIVSGKPLYIPLCGRPGDPAMMQNPGDHEGYLSLTKRNSKDDGDWRNLATVGSGLATLVYRPMNHVANIRAPTLLIGAERDTLCPAGDSQDAANIILKGEYVSIPNLGHFDIYDGEALRQILKITIVFFHKHLLLITASER